MLVINAFLYDGSPFRPLFVDFRHGDRNIYERNGARAIGRFFIFPRLRDTCNAQILGGLVIAVGVTSVRTAVRAS